MKAWVLHGIDDLRYEDHDLPVPGRGEVLVRVKAAGICGSDIPRAYKTGAHRHPLVIGHEFAGWVCRMGEGVDSSWQDKPVGIFPLIPCRTCLPCSRGQYEMCRNYNYLGSRCDGGFAEYAAVPAANLIGLPAGVSYEQAAMMEPMAVAVHAMRRGFELAGQRADDAFSVAVCGLGTIGLLLVMFLRRVGVRNLYVIGKKEAQAHYVREMGIPESDYCDSGRADVRQWLAQKTGGRGVDLFFECVGKNETVCQAIDAAAPAGTVVLVGNPYSDMMFDKDTYWKILRNQLRVTGTWNSSFTHEADDDWHYVLNALADGSAAPERFITHRFDMRDLDQGFHIMRDKTEDYVKIMGVCTEEEGRCA